MKAGKIVYCVFILYNYFVSMSADWNPYAAENVAGSSSPQPINNVLDAASANDYPLGIQTNENSFVNNALFHDQDDFFSGLEMYEHFYENTVPPPANTVSHTVPVMSQTAQPSQIETIVVDLLSQISSSIQQAQGGDNIVELHGGPSIQTSVASSSSTEPVRHRRRRNSIDRTIVAMTSDELAADSGPWRKYGQKPIKGTPHPRHYYRCSKGKGCSAKKTVQRNLIDPNTFTVSYCGEHSHRHVTQRGSFAENTPNMLVLGDGNNNSINHPLQIGSLSSPGSGSNSTQSPPTMLGGANMQNNDAQMVEHRDDEYENLMMINDLMSNDIPIFIGLQDSNESSNVLMSPPWSPIFDDVFNFEDGDWGISKPK